MPDSASVSRAVSTPACSARIPILPIRYAIVPRASGGPHVRYTDSGFALEQGFAALHHSAYTLRALREGYVYVFMKGPCGEKLVIHEYNGAGRYRELRYRGLEGYHRRDSYTTGPTTGWVWADTYQDTAGEVWIGYSSHLWSNAMCARVMASATLRGRHMRALDIPELIAGGRSPSSQAHVLPVSALRNWVEDFKPDSLRMNLDWSSHPCPQMLSFGMLAGMARHYPYTQPRVPAVVALHDAEGISMDLALSANAFQHALRDPSAPDPGRHAFGAPPASQEPVPACYRLDVERICKPSQAYHHKSIVAALLEKSLHTLYPPTAPDLAQATRERAARDRLSPSLARYKTLTDERHSPQGARLGLRIDSARYEAFIAERDARQQVLADLQTQALRASADHDLWLATAESEHVDDPKTLAAAFASYDRDNYASAIGLEMSLALMLGGMSQPVPGAEDQDLRFKRLEKWLDQHDSPLYLALAPFNPFRDRADAAGTLIGASDSTIEIIAGRFPAIADITDLTAQAVYTVVLKRLNGQTRWNASHSFQQRVLAAVQEANAEKAVGLLSTRYKITGQAIRESALSRAVTEFIDAGMAQIEESKTLRISGSRTVTLEMTTTQSVKPKVKAILGSIAGAGLSAGILWLNIVNLKAAYANVQKISAPEYTTGFASAIFGVIGSMTAAIVTARSAQKSVIVKLSSSAPGMAFGNGLIKLVTSKGYSRAVGYPAILLGLASDVLKAKRQGENGNEGAAVDTLASGLAISIGSALILEGSIAITAAAFLIPLTIILLGASILTAGLLLQAKATEHLHSPLELWATRTVFGTLLNDGEERPDLRLDASLRLPRFLNLTEEVKNWYSIFYAPIKISKKQAQALGFGFFGSTMDNTTRWAHPDWGTIVQTGVEHSHNKAVITVLLRGFLLGLSTWKASASRRDHRSQTSVSVTVEPTTHLTPEGLILNFSTNLPHGDSLDLRVDYFPQQGIDENEKSTTTLSVSPHE